MARAVGANYRAGTPAAAVPPGPTRARTKRINWASARATHLVPSDGLRVSTDTKNDAGGLVLLAPTRQPRLT